MKTTKTILALGTCCAVALLAGCEKKSETTGTSTDQGTSAAQATGDTMKKAADAVATEANQAVDAAKPMVEKTATEVKSAATAAVSTVSAAVQPATSTASADVNAKVNQLIDQAKTLLGQSKYSDALNTLQQVNNFKLSPEQQQLVTSLKEQIQKAMAAAGATNAAGAVGNLLNK
ncbi:MAG TPA: hypothetical protein VFV96_08295 [Verrucomicrobiae bacterium]|nr:hypothetical protein [Verrucomicrobiae bacterium]